MKNDLRMVAMMAAEQDSGTVSFGRANLISVTTGLTLREGPQLMRREFDSLSCVPESSAAGRMNRLSSSVPALLCFGLLALFLFSSCSTRRQPAAAEPPPRGFATVTYEEAEPTVTALVGQIIERAEDHYRQGCLAFLEEDWAEAEKRYALALSLYAKNTDLIREDQRLAEAYEDLLERVTPLKETVVLRIEEEALWLEQSEPAPVDGLADLDSGEITEDQVTEETPPLTEELAARQDLPVEINSRVRYFIERYQKQDRNFFAQSLVRRGAWIDMIREIFAETGIPTELAAMALVESGYKTKALSRARAYGMWQFMQGTARLYEMCIDSWQDERADPEKATRAAARHLKDLFDDLGDWKLAMAAYNAGQGRVERAIKRTGSRDYWTISQSRHLVRETRNYVPAILAAVVILRDPARYGFNVEPAEPMVYDKVTVDSWVDLDKVALCAATDLATIHGLNPDLKYNTTPPNRIPYELKIPQGQAEAFNSAFAKIPADQRVVPQIHTVRRGDTLHKLASTYRTTVTTICQMNGINSRSVLSVNQKLLIPSGPNAPSWTGSTTSGGGAAAGDYEFGRQITYKVRRGDTLNLIASRYGTSCASIAQWNKISEKSLIHPGQRLTIHCGRQVSGGGSSGGSQRVAYRVRRGDTLSAIARKYNTSVGSIRHWNKLPSVRIYPGDMLTIYVE
jgi:membrane-bound lytic murein transglycosylase D